MSKPSQREQVQKGLQHLKGSDKIIGDIVGYCVQAYKADSSVKTIEKVRKYVEDTANSVSEHVLTIAHNLNRIIESEAKEIEDLAFQAGYVSHRLKSHQRYMSELFMTKFQTFPRPRPTIHILRQAIPENQLPRYARRKRPWQRQTGFDYKILDQVGARKTDGTGGPASPRYGPSGVASPSASGQSPASTGPAAFSVAKPQAAGIKPFNPYEASSPSNNSKPAVINEPPKPSKAAVAAPKGPTLFQQSKQSGFGFNKSFNAPPPSFGSIDANAPSRDMRASVVNYVGVDDDNKQSKPPAVPNIPPMASGGPPQPPAGPPQPPPVPNFGASFAAGGGPPPVPPVPSDAAAGGGGGPPPVPPVPNAANGGPPAVPSVPSGGPPGPPPPPPN